MRFEEIDLFGVSVAPMSLMLVAAWMITIALAGSPRASGYCAMFGTRRCSFRLSA